MLPKPFFLSAHCLLNGNCFAAAIWPVPGGRYAATRQLRELIFSGQGLVANRPALRALFTGEGKSQAKSARISGVSRFSLVMTAAPLSITVGTVSPFILATRAFTASWPIFLGFWTTSA